MNKKKITIIAVVVLAVIVAVLGVSLLLINNHNKQVEKYAQECGDKLCDVSIDFADTTIDENIVNEKFVELSNMIQNNEFVESKLTYFDGSKEAYNAVKEKSDYLLLQYQVYIQKRFSDKFQPLDIDVNNASLDQLNSTLEQLNLLLTDLDKSWNNTSFDNQNSNKWSMAWGDTEESANNAFNDFKNKVVNKANEVKSTIDKKQQTSNNVNTSSSQNGSNNGSYSGGSSGGSGGGGQSGPTIEQAEAAWQAYVQNCHAHGMEPILSHDEFIRKYMYGG